MKVDFIDESQINIFAVKSREKAKRQLKEC